MESWLQLSLQGHLQWISELSSLKHWAWDTQTNFKILRSHAETILSRNLSFWFIFNGWLCHNKLLLYLSIHKINYPSEYDLLLVPIILVSNTFLQWKFLLSRKECKSWLLQFPTILRRAMLTPYPPRRWCLRCRHERLCGQ